MKFCVCICAVSGLDRIVYSASGLHADAVEEVLLCVRSIERENERDLQRIRSASRRAFAFCEVRVDAGFC